MTSFLKVCMIDKYRYVLILEQTQDIAFDSFYYRIRPKPFDPSIMRLSPHLRAPTLRRSRTFGTTPASRNATTDGENISSQTLPNSMSFFSSPCSRLKIFFLFFAILYYSNLNSLDVKSQEMGSWWRNMTFF